MHKLLSVILLSLFLSTGCTVNIVVGSSSGSGSSTGGSTEISSTNSISSASSVTSQSTSPAASSAAASSEMVSSAISSAVSSTNPSSVQSSMQPSSSFSSSTASSLSVSSSAPSSQQASSAATVITFTAPTNNQSVPEIFSLTGTAPGAYEVYLSVDSMAIFGKVSGADNWTTNLNLTAGAHIIRAYWNDSGLNQSAIKSIHLTVTNTPPWVTFTDLTNGQPVTNPVPITGNAGDNVSVASVWLSANSGAFAQVAGTTSWQTNLQLYAPTNWLDVYALDQLGNASPTNHLILSNADAYPAGIYVSWLNGLDINNGARDNPVTTLEKAIQLAAETGKSNIYIDNSGVYDLTAAISLTNNQLNFIGAFDPGFSSSNSARTIIRTLSNNAFNLFALTNISFSHLVFTGNTNDSMWGGALEIYGGSNITVVNCVFSNLLSERGGAIYVSGGNHLVISNCLIISNQANVYSASGGGGIYLSKARDSSVVNCTIQDNCAPLGFGGAIVIMRGTNITISGSLISNNWSSVYGDFCFFIGGAYNADSGLTNLVISNNKIGGTNGSTNAVGISEEFDGSGGLLNIAGHTLVDNIFYTHTLGTLYRNANGTAPQFLTNIDDINTPEKTGAAVASGNTVQ